MLIGGGGGSAKTGIPNQMVLYSIDLEKHRFQKRQTIVIPNATNCVALRTQGRLLACAVDDMLHLICYNPIARRHFTLGKVKADHDKEPELKVVSFNAAGNRILTGGADGVVRLWTWKEDNNENEEKPKKGGKKVDTDDDEKGSLQVVKELKNEQSVADAAWCVADDKVIVVAYSNKTCRVWNTESGATLKTIQLDRPGYTFRNCRWLDEKRIVTLEVEKRKASFVSIWDTTSGKRIRSTTATKETGVSFNLSPDGKYIAVGSPDGNVVVLKTESISKVMSITPHDFVVTGVAFTPDSRSIVSTSFDKTCSINPIKESGSTWIILLSLLVLLIAFYFFVYK
eukprot:TRINITY_DN5925_c0_g2_i1.p1 TRINITY_DN5925_c0_g2~~TRINITY_DN5925_c0_g2_i1.p1  ORF type:complete len:377 (-),score=86.53 TRINITY_DN5925_c0_g2_i1:122-1144(-)